MEFITDLYAASKIDLNLQLLQEKREIKKRRESCFQTLYTTPGGSTHPIIFVRLTVMAMQCVLLGISEVMRISEIIETDATRGQEYNLEFSEQHGSNMIRDTTGLVVTTSPLVRSIRMSQQIIKVLPTNRYSLC
jgi:hypothetical protein